MWPCIQNSVNSKLRCSTEGALTFKTQWTKQHIRSTAGKLFVSFDCCSMFMHLNSNSLIIIKIHEVTHTFFFSFFVQSMSEKKMVNLLNREWVTATLFYWFIFYEIWMWQRAKDDDMIDWKPFHSNLSADSIELIACTHCAANWFTF